MCFSCKPKPDSLARKNFETINVQVEKLLADTLETKTAYELALPLLELGNQYLLMQEKARELYPDEETWNRYDMNMPGLDELLAPYWERVVKANRTQMKKLPTNTWMINQDTQSVSSIFQVNKTYSEIYPYNYKKIQNLNIPTAGDVEYGSSLIFLFFFNYDPETKLMEIRTVDGKVGHFRKATDNELAMGLYYGSNGDELCCYKASDVKVSNTFWGLVGWVIEVDIDGRELCVMKSERGSGVIDELGDINGDRFYRQRESSTPYDFIFVIPEAEKRALEMSAED